MAKLRGASASEAQAVEAMARLYLALEHAIARLEALDAYDKALFERSSKLLLLHRSHIRQMDEMVDLFETMADGAKSWPQWINEIIESAAHPEAGLAVDPVEAVKTSERRLLAAIDAAIPLTWTDPVRDTLEHMRVDTALAQRDAGIVL